MQNTNYYENKYGSFCESTDVINEPPIDEIVSLLESACEIAEEYKLHDAVRSINLTIGEIKSGDN